MSPLSLSQNHSTFNFDSQKKLKHFSPTFTITLRVLAGLWLLLMVGMEIAYRERVFVCFYRGTLNSMSSYTFLNPLSR